MNFFEIMYPFNYQQFCIVDIVQLRCYISIGDDIVHSTTIITTTSWYTIALKINTGIKVGNLPITIIVRDRSQAGISRNFRGHDVRCAGNFFRWDTLDEFLEDDEFLYVLKEDVEEALRENDLYRTFEYDFTASIGWSSTVPLGQIDEGFLESFFLNKIAFGMRVKSAHQDIKAPMTRTVTVTYELKCETDRGNGRQQLSVVIFSIHPGVGIGPIRGNMSTPRKESPGWIFFDRNHPAE